MLWYVDAWFYDFSWLSLISIHFLEFYDYFRFLWFFLIFVISIHFLWFLWCLSISSISMISWDFAWFLWFLGISYDFFHFWWFLGISMNVARDFSYCFTLRILRSAFGKIQGNKRLHAEHNVEKRFHKKFNSCHKFSNYGKERTPLFKSKSFYSGGKGCRTKMRGHSFSSTEV